ncbi:putative multi antimicrobial extrusion protein [Lupinus albus]|uniref:Protein DETOXIFICATION n=1 Tax=Lupinus albus TaxID=3870 RepID=A0A6A4PAM6_LUPAL|nr:putative multi antimicrobial extrusion protein [Lupinus albus]
MSSNETSTFREAKVPLFDEDSDGEKEKEGILGRIWVESKKLWNIAGPAIFNRVANYNMIIITQASAGHVGDLELAATSIAVNVILGLDIGLMLGMSSALETLCGQAFGAKKHYMLGVYMQRSWVILFITSVVVLPWFLFTTPILILFGQPPEIANLAGVISKWLIPTHLAFAFFFPLHFFLQSQLKNKVIAWVSLVALVLHAFISWLVLYKFELGVISVVAAGNISWWIMVLGYFGYIVLGNCPSTWTGFSLEAFSGLREFTTLSVASGIMICLEVWYDKVLMLMTGILHNAKTSVEALTICLSINIWQLMFPLSFLAAVGVRVANELGAGNGKGAKFATMVAVMTSFIISVFFWLLIMNFRSKFAYIFSSSEVVIEEVNKLSPLLGFTILLNSVQPVLSGVAVGSGWQKYVAYINLGCYYGIGLPLGYLLGFVFNLGVEGIWAGLIFGGTAVQTLILTVITIRCNWDKEAEKARLHLRKWEGPNKRTEE